MDSIKQVLMKRDGIDAVEAQALIDEAQEQIDSYIAEGDMDSAYNICQEYFGLEPDYLMELI